MLFSTVLGLKMAKYGTGLVFFLFAAATDIRERKIRTWAFPLMALLVIMADVALFATGGMDETPARYAAAHGLGMAAGFAVTILPAMLEVNGKVMLGGADVLMCTFLGLAFGLSGLAWTAIAAVVACMAYSMVGFVLCVATHRKFRRDIPMAPFMCVGYAVYMVLCLIP